MRNIKGKKLKFLRRFTISMSKIKLNIFEMYLKFMRKRIIL